MWMVLTRSISVKSWLRLREKMSWSFCIPDCTCVTYDRQLCKASSGSHSSISVRHWISQITFFHRNREIMILKTSQPTLILLLQLEFFLLALLCGKEELPWSSLKLPRKKEYTICPCCPKLSSRSQVELIILLLTFTSHKVFLLILCIDLLTNGFIEVGDVKQLNI